MGREIERKYLVGGDGWRGLAAGTLYRQGYLSTAQERTVRVRLAGARGFLTIKGPAAGPARSEFEYEIPSRDAEQLLQLCEVPLIEKTRYRIPYGRFVWEVDEFHGVNDGLILAECELEAPDQQPDKPDWVGREVTGDPRYANASLVRRPYRTW